jgi:hypothetical protein
MESETAESYQEDERDEEDMVGAACRFRPAQQQPESASPASRKAALLAALTGSARSASLVPRSQ